jgi:DNA-binding CsgD family transcriptional regulator
MSKRGRPKFDDILTPAEWRVVDAVRHGMTSRAIGVRRGISIDAVKYHVANALDKVGLRGRAQLRLWTGVARQTHLSAKELPMHPTQPLGAIGQIARTVVDVAAATAWYKDVLGLTHLYAFGDLSFFDCAGIRLFLSQGAPATHESIIYFKVDDIRASHAALLARGAVFVSAPHIVHRHANGTEEWMAFLQDNEGRHLAIMSQEP